MHNPFTFTDEEKACVTGKEQLAMLERLVEFVNEQLTQIDTLQSKVENLENNQPTPSK